MFEQLYDATLRWSRHRHAPYYLAGLSFAESSFFPIPPDVMLAPMALANLNRAWWLAALTSAASVAGGAFGYLIGYLFFSAIFPLLQTVGYAAYVDDFRVLFNEWGFWGVFLGAVTPLPYKVFTITAGMMHMNMMLFLAASIIGRSLRFFLVAGLMVYGGVKMERYLKKNVNNVGWAVLSVVVIVLLLRRFF